ncbi:MAG: glucose-6-phosphate isomerase [Clostridia bacterium]|nr:glucose-6-phosphate isomerase [Clostridia bacterium]
MKINLEYGLVKQHDIFAKDYQKKIREINANLHSEDHSAGTTWVHWPTDYNTKEFLKIQKLAREIKESSDALIVIGIGGSYLGAKAGIDMLAKKSKVEIIFAGITFDYYDLGAKLESLKNKDVTVNIVSKSGSTVEILSTLNIVERFMKNKYKSGYASRMIYTTSEGSYLYNKAVKEGSETLSVPENMGGRYSVLSAVGLLPFAVADIKIRKILEGAKKAQDDLDNENVSENIAYQYAIYRHLLNKKLNKKVELFSTFHTQLSSFNFWLQQLFCESEGKDGEGMFVSPLTFSTDLHSVGQFIQQGTPFVAETFLTVENSAKDNTLSNIPLGSPIKFLDGKTFSEINYAAFDGTVKAHREAKVPICIISIDEINEFNFGYLVYFFELACGASGYLLKVNPFDQPGVEQYKAYMKENLKK